MSLVSDLFPNQVLEKTGYPELEAAIEQQVEESGLVYHPPWVLKLIQVGLKINFNQIKTVLTEHFSSTSHMAILYKITVA